MGPGTRIADRFVLAQELGAGGMGEVWRAWDEELGVEVALKFLHAVNSEAGSAIKQEFRMLRTIRHPNLVRLGQLYGGDPWFFSMELIDGGVGLLDWVGASTPAREARETQQTGRGAPGESATHRSARLAVLGPSYDEARLRECLGALAGAIGALEQANVVHCDLTPRNILVAPDGRVVVLDFGLAQRGRDGAASDAVAGTLPYMSPEQLLGGAITSASDRFSLGVVLYEALVGRWPYSNALMESLREKQEGTFLPPGVLVPDTPRDLDLLCTRLLAPDPAQRASLADVAAVAGTATSTRPRRVSLSGLDATPPALVGRSAAMGRLHDWLDRVRMRRRCGVAIVYGQAGIGRSRVLHETGRAADGFLTLSGRCLQYESIPRNALDSLSDALAKHLETLDDDVVDELAGDDAQAACRLFPVLEPLVPSRFAWVHAPAAGPVECMNAVAGILRRLSERTPVLLVVDDMQWADDDSVAGLAQIAAACSGHPVGMLLSVQTRGAGHRARDGVQRLARAARIVEHVVLSPLDATNSLALARSLCSSEAALAEVVVEAGGVPGRIVEVVTAAHSSDPAGASGTDDLAPADWSILAVLALALSPMPNEVVASVAELVYADYADRLDALRLRGLIAGSGLRRTEASYVPHAQVRAAAWERCGADDTRRIHRGLAARLRDVGGQPLVAATHARLAGDYAAAIGDVRGYADEAETARERLDACRVCEQMLSHDLGREELVDCLDLYADVLVRLGEVSRAADALAEASDLDESSADRRRRAVELLMQSGRMREALGFARALASAEGVDVDAGPDATVVAVVRERLLLTLRRLRTRAPSAPPDPGLLERSEVCHGLALGFGHVDFLRAAALHARAARLALASGDPDAGARALALEACFQATRRGGSDKTERLLARAVGLVGDGGRNDVAPYLAMARGFAAHFAGDYHRAVPEFDEAAELFLADDATRTWEATTAHQIALWGLGWQGLWGEVARRLDRLRPAAVARGDVLARTYFHIGLVVCGDLARDRSDIARGGLEEAMARWQELVPAPADVHSVQTPYLHALIGEATIDLYEGLAPDALHRLDRAWRRLERSRRLGVQQLAATLGELRVRAAIGVSAWDPDRRGTAKRLLRALPRVEWLAGPAALARAALQAAEADADGAKQSLEQARAACERHRLPLRALAARARWGALVGGDEGKTVRVRAMQDIRQLGIHDPHAALSAVAPWPASEGY